VDGWGAQAITVSYERARRGRAVGERSDGFVITASKTVAIPVERLFDAFVDESTRDRWLPDGELLERTSTRPKSARFDWGDGETRVNVGFLAKGAERSTVDLEHERLPDAEQADRMKAHCSPGTRSPWQTAPDGRGRAASADPAVLGEHRR
jgi:hypothetical protein